MGRLRAARPVLETLLCLAVSLVAGLTLAGYFDGWGWWWPVAATALAGAALGLLPVLRRGDPAIAAVAVVAGGVLVAAAVVVPPALRAEDGWAAAAAAVPASLVHSWSRMLTSALPVRPAPDLTVLPVVLSWIAAAGASLLARRSRVLLLPLLPPFVLFLVGLLLTPTGTPDLGLTAAFLGLALLLLFLRASTESDTWSGSLQAEPLALGSVSVEAPQAAELRPWGRAAVRRPGFGHLALGLPLVAVTGVFGVLGASLVPDDGDRFDPRSVWSPPLQELDVPNPLVRLKSRLEAEPPVELFTATVRTGRPIKGPLRFRTAALDRFDGYGWAARGRFARPAARLAVPPDVGRHGTFVDLRVRLGPGAARLESPFLPVIGVPTRLQAEDAEFDPASGAVALRRGATGGYGYSLTGWLPVADQGITGTAAAPDAASSLALDLPPDLPADLTELAARVTKDQSTAYGQLKALETYLRSVPYSLEPAPGSSYAAISRMLLGTAAEDRAGFAEQHAAAFAVMARGLSLPARVSVGYAVPAERAATGQVVVTTKDAHAWPEVHFTGYGWIPFEPTDARKVPGTGRTPPAGATLPTGELEPDPTLGPAATTGPAGLGQQVVRLWPWLLAALPPILLLAVAGVWALKHRRRSRRRRAATSAQRVLGAWSEGLDRLTEAGWRPEASLSPPQLAAATRDRFGPAAAAPVEELVPLVEQAVFAAPPIPLEAVTRAWAEERRLAAALDARRRPPWRWARVVDPRPLLRRRALTAASTAGPAAGSTAGSTAGPAPIRPPAPAQG